MGCRDYIINVFILWHWFRYLYFSKEYWISAPNSKYIEFWSLSLVENDQRFWTFVMLCLSLTQTRLPDVFPLQDPTLPVTGPDFFPLSVPWDCPLPVLSTDPVLRHSSAYDSPPQVGLTAPLSVLSSRFSPWAPPGPLIGQNRVATSSRQPAAGPHLGPLLVLTTSWPWSPLWHVSGPHYDLLSSSYALTLDLTTLWFWFCVLTLFHSIPDTASHFALTLVSPHPDLVYCNSRFGPHCGHNSLPHLDVTLIHTQPCLVCNWAWL